MFQFFLPSRRLAASSFLGASMILSSSSHTPVKCLSTAAAAAASSTSTSSSMTTPTLTLYQYQVCPFCNKVQTFLEYHKVPHTRIEVNPLSKREMKFSTYKKVPFLVVKDEKEESSLQVNGSDAVIDWISSEVLHDKSETSKSEQEWRSWCDDHLIHLLPPNIYRTPQESIQAFDYISNASNFSAFEKFTAKYTGALAMYFIAKRSLKKYNITNPRLELQEALELWAEKGVMQGPFHGGKQPDKADLSVFGVIRSIEGNYATWTDMQDKVNPNFWTWYAAMKTLISPPVLNTK